MSSRRMKGEPGKTELVYLVLYRLRTMTDDEKRQWFKEWIEIRKMLPKEMRIITEVGNAFGTEFTGFIIFEGPLDKFEVLNSLIDRHAGHMLERTKTIIGTKGIVIPTGDIKRILERRPID
ncbi:MAG: hypothetical protein RTU30_09495 [Candidatus Thorarchaeota archaeon]